MIDRDKLLPLIAANVARLRKEAGLSQKDLAARVGVTYVTINRVENGHHTPHADLLYSIADALRVPADALRQLPLEEKLSKTA